ncbi:MAG: hypothetical protein L6247_05205, partial [Desulfobacteraceae bacterium]|nr:hypothetical protein [Desulfobacteraceae bacterium]
FKPKPKNILPEFFSFISAIYRNPDIIYLLHLHKISFLIVQCSRFKVHGSRFLVAGFWFLVLMTFDARHIYSSIPIL